MSSVNIPSDPNPLFPWESRFLRRAYSWRTDFDGHREHELGVGVGPKSRVNRVLINNWPLASRVA